MQQQIKNFRRHLRLAFLIPLLLGAMLAAVFGLQTYFLSTSMRSVEHSYQVQTRSRSLLKLILDMETGMRGYLLTGEERFLQPYRVAAPQAEPAFDQLAGLVGNDPEQAPLISHLRDAYRQWRTFSERMIGKKSSGELVSDVDENMQGKMIMDEIRSDRDRLLQIEEGRLQHRVEDVKQTLRVLFVTVLALTCFMGLLVATYSRRELSKVARSYDRVLLTSYTRSDELDRNQRLLSTVLASIEDAVVAADLKGQIVFSNSVAEELLQLSGEHRGGFTRDAIRLEDEFTHEPLPDIVDVVSKTGERYLSGEHSVLVSGNNTRTPVHLIASPMRDSSGKMSGVVIVLRNLTEQRQSERSLASAEKMASIGRIAASVAHEIHNPLDSIGNLLYLLEHGNLDETSKTYVRLAREELERISNISEQMLTFSREAKQPVQVSVAEVLDNVLTLFAARIRRMGVIVVKNYQADLVVLAFPGELRQVFSNLIGNALDAMNGPGRLTIRTESTFEWAENKQAGARVLVCDTGSGIPTEVRPKLMDPFVTSKGEKGTGLGLWVCKGIVEKYHGSLRYRTSTTPGKSGTCFSVFIPSNDGSEGLTRQRAIETPRERAS